MSYNNALIIGGPTTTGKTKVAFEIARRINGEVIHADLYYFYSSFSTSTGLADIKKESDVPTHLYGILQPDEQLVTIDQYVSKVNTIAYDILRRGSLPIIEGCTPGYIGGLIREKSNQKLKYEPIILLESSDWSTVIVKIRERIKRMFKEGVVDEVKAGLEEGYHHTHIMRHDIVISPIVKYLDGIISLEDAKAEIYQFFVRAYQWGISAFYDLYRENPKAIWITHEPSNLDRTVEHILSVFKKDLLK